MKLMRVGPKGQEKPALLDSDGTIRSLEGVVDDIAGRTLGDGGLMKLASRDTQSLPEVDPATRVGSCVGAVGKVICIGLNYADHAAEAGMDLPREPIIFMKATSALCGPNDDLEIPRGSTKTDWEAELAVVIGKAGRYIDEADWEDHVAGYACMNDVSERAFQIESTGQWVKGKSHDSFAPLGPWLVTKDEFGDPNDKAIWLEVDGHRYQDGTTATLVFKIPHLISYVSCFMSLQPGDVIATGTPPGVGMGQKPEPVYLKPGQSLRLGIEGLGEQRQTTVQA